MRISLLAIILIFQLGCSKSNDGGSNPPPPPPASTFAKGADVSWLTEMENAGKKFYNKNGTEQDLYFILKGIGMNAIRLRVWVNPVGGWNNKSDVLAKALRAKSIGMKIMLNFHYSDSWADPGQQNKPTAWSAVDFIALKTAVYDHTRDVMATLKLNNVVPDWVQVGNETNDGMLWPDGRASTNMGKFAELVNSGYDAVKAESASTKVIVHISNGHDNTLFRWIIGGLVNSNARFDVIGMSLYPDVANFSTMNAQCLTNMQDMITRYNKGIMITEVGMSWDQAAACKTFLTDIINKTKSLPNNKGLGVFYWEPQSYNNWKGYTKGAFDNSGKPTIAMESFQ